MKKLMIAFVLILLSGCANSGPTSIEIDLFNPEGDKLGTATLLESAEGVKVNVKAEGFEPGPHGFHIHEEAKCEGPDFKTAGGHFNPEDKKHGLLNAKGAHAGDLPNIEADPDGKIEAETVATGVTLKGGQTSLLDNGGTSLIIHEKADDGMSQPSGDAGKRVACGKITTEEAKAETGSNPAEDGEKKEKK